MMESTAVVRCLAAVATVALLGGCIARIPDDATFVSVEAVDWYDEGELPGKGADRQHRLMLKTTFTSATDLIQFVREHSYSLGAGAFFCDDPEERGGVAYPPIYWRGIRLDSYDRDVSGLKRNSEGDAFVYYVYLDTEELERPWHLSPGKQNVYDLRRAPKDVCLYVSGGSMSGFGYKSNSVVVPASEIEAALNDLPPAFR